MNDSAVCIISPAILYLRPSIGCCVVCHTFCLMVPSLGRNTQHSFESVDTETDWFLPCCGLPTSSFTAHRFDTCHL